VERTGSDISAIPTDAIERVEIRDGASAQYGSDAIAVMNISLKEYKRWICDCKKYNSEGDGEMVKVLIMDLQLK
jgi:iron complex outermembrane receptor protein